ncbi:sugar phosphate isomerase/epimerase family protein [Flavobacterium luteum]|uniref:Sugar phosphate isomerase/epimerase n=1 Tax=Flavobacterium luteum TaxID=2026654 RepID=A0A7J5AKF4_9FLAO|nr:sugar phosphate isomerase/epimerase [Flavobacterium luteum]KAB1158056.1 sugar phosphate isomerase/epimerase [Flavobacterium luteum]
MKIKYSFSYWGNDHLSPSQFINAIADAGFDGAELFLNPIDRTTDEFLLAIENIRKQKPDFYFITLQLPFPKTDTVGAHIKVMEENFRNLAELNPLFINSHTGKDYFSFDDNCRIIDAAMNFSSKNGIRILHETHRGRFSFHAASLIPYLNTFPQIELVGDFSHFCTVSESMLEDQQEIISQIIPHVAHIHARLGFEQGPQVNDPQAPEWHGHLEKFLFWWQQIITTRKVGGQSLFTISPEFGPIPYMPTLPYTQKPLSNQWDNNVFMKNYLKASLK